MASFITRVELQNASAEDYERLHSEMESRGFKRTISGKNGTSYKLPTATYSLSFIGTASQVSDQARNAANATGRKNWIITTEGPSSWYLPEV
ncbi:type V toxin-antitoxin system endoribonuclease antitoxin GhoS [Paraburkholderia sp. C35]|uniref:type V toxin-antitoxin system endoribonuclease antitoxin GhoS n=1 Tax=Paraburkholderia sp. C35 TaxID=2126993 RepID=UPI000D6917B1|nr:type V toxin-antitoxin system endoribonuclease antitoxin GhoS [Paraburkholderia sp. C35]